MTESFKTKLILKFRQVTWSERAFPSFIVIGAQKSGTTSLLHYLSSHPQIVPPYSKEVHFFDGGLNPNIDTFKQGESWYRSHFPLLKELADNKKTFEVSPLYLFNPLVPLRIYELLPDVKLIVLLRNPVERALSHYFHEKRCGREPLSIMKAFLSEEERFAPIIDKKDYKNSIFIHHSYKTRGLYYEQLKRFADCFPWDNILVLNSETFFEQPKTVLRQVFEFTGVDSEVQVDNLKPYNVGTNKSAIGPEVYEYLQDYFHPHNQKLYELTGRNYAWQ